MSERTTHLMKTWRDRALTAEAERDEWQAAAERFNNDYLEQLGAVQQVRELLDDWTVGDDSRRLHAPHLTNGAHWTCRECWLIAAGDDLHEALGGEQEAEE